MKINHPFIELGKLDRRDYQLNIARSCRDRSSLVVIPTGMGKTIIAVLIMAARLEEHKNEPNKKYLFLAPTKPLADQHKRFIREFMTVDEDRVELFTGKVPPAQREALWKEKDIIIATPQVIQNDLIARKIDLKDVALLIFDESHRAVGEYAYVYIARKYREQAKRYQVLGITASPGSNEEHIIEVCKNLYIPHIEIRSEYDADVLPYVHEVDTKWHMVHNPPGIQRVVEHLEGIQKKYLQRLQKFGLVGKTSRVSKRELLEIQKRIQGKIKASRNPPRSLFVAASTQSAAIKVNHAIELLETQGVTSFKVYVSRLERDATSKGGTKGARMLWGDDKFRYVIDLLDQMEETHPKIPELVNLIRRQIRVKRDSKVLVFTHYRDMAAYLEKKLNGYSGIRASRFVGQASRDGDKGFSQKKQVETIQQFKEKEFNVLLATSVAEEGLDIPSTDRVIFYEPIPSEIRSIQRRGRTGRQESGKVDILITKGTRDEAYYWSSKNKEHRMKDQLNLHRDELIRKVKEEIELMEMADALVGGEIRPPEEREARPVLQNPEPLTESSSTPPPEPGPVSEVGDEETALKAPKNPAARTLDPVPEPVPTPTPTHPPQKPKILLPPKNLTKQKPLPQAEGQARLFDFDGMLEQDMKKPLPLSEVTLVVDHREFRSSVVRLLSDYGIKVEGKQLDTADFVVSSLIGIERKEVKDFLSSLSDGRLFTQLIQLSTTYPCPILIIEGKENIFTERGFRPGAIFGSFASLLVDVKVPIIMTEDASETADLIYALIKREYAPGKKIAVRQAPSGRSIRDRQRYVVEGLPNVSAVLAERILEHFGSVGAVFKASEKELLEVKGVGKKTVEEIRKVLEEEFG